MMTSTQRRQALLEALQTESAPLSASRLAKTLSVSRQLVVGDVALLRAAGQPIIATPRGYVLQAAQQEGVLCTVACRHTPQRIAQELYLMVDCGCKVLDVIVEHPVYGQLSGQLQISSRYDADLFCAALLENEAQPLCRLTGDVHLHTLACPTQQHQERVLQALAQHDFLA